MLCQDKTARRVVPSFAVPVVLIVLVLCIVTKVMGDDTGNPLEASVCSARKP